MMGRSMMEGVSDGEWSVFAEKVVKERDRALEQVTELKKALEGILNGCDCEDCSCAAHAEEFARRVLDGLYLDV
jgi:hypothetical protein